MSCVLLFVNLFLFLVMALPVYFRSMSLNVPLVSYDPLSYIKLLSQSYVLYFCYFDYAIVDIKIATL